jgi:predicted Zn-dependent protease
MSAKAAPSDMAFRVADRLRTDGPWDVIGERSTRFEVHLQGAAIELERGPITVEGYGVRLFRPRGDKLGTGFQGSTDTSPEGVRAVLEDAEATARHSEFPARTVELPSGGRAPAEVLSVDRGLWSDPVGSIRAYVDALLRPFEGRKGAVPSFGSVKATLTELSFANSAGLKVSFPCTRVDLELAVKAFGGPEGAPPGEFWVTHTAGRLEPESAARSVEAWCRHAADVRHAVTPPTGDQAVILPPPVLTDILPHVLGFQFTGVARLRRIAPKLGAAVAADRVTIRDEGTYPWGARSAPYDDEGAPRGTHALIERGSVAGLLYDSLYASAFATGSTGSATRTTLGPSVDSFGDLRFTQRSGPGGSTIVVAPGDGGTTDELVEAAGEGILVTQLGWANPNPISGSFGGEIRIGYRIRGGKIAEPVRGGTIGGAVLAPPGAPSMLANAEAIGRDLELCGYLAAPAILVRPLSVAGSSP